MLYHGVTGGASQVRRIISSFKDYRDKLNSLQIPSDLNSTCGPWLNPEWFSVQEILAQMWDTEGGL